MWQPNAGLVYR